MRLVYPELANEIRDSVEPFFESCTIFNSVVQSRSVLWEWEANKMGYTFYSHRADGNITPLGMKRGNQ